MRRIFPVGGRPHGLDARLRGATFVIALAALGSPHATDAQAAPKPATRVQQLATIAWLEDGRGTQGRNLDSIVTYVRSGDPVVRAAAIRGLGRQQSVRFLPTLYASLRDPSPLVRLQGVNAIGQALQGLKGQRGSNVARELNLVADSLERAATSLGATGRDVSTVLRTLGRLPWPDSGAARAAEQRMLVLGRAGAAGASLGGLLHGFYSLARQRRTLGTPAPAALDVARVAFGNSAGVQGAILRRLALLTLTAAGAAELALAHKGLGDPDEQVRRLAVLAAASLRDTTGRGKVIGAAMRDASFLVRLEGVRLARGVAAAGGCDVMLAALGDPSPHVAMAALDGLSSACPDRTTAVSQVLRTIDANRADGPVRAKGHAGWHLFAHAIPALARLDAERARAIVRRETNEATLWSVRTYVARAATTIRDTASLYRLAVDTNPNVRELALRGLGAVVGHGADSLYRRALAATQYQVVMAGADLLKGTPDRTSAVTELYRSLERLTSEQRENSRDPREAILQTLDELGTSDLAGRLSSWRSDFDSTIAQLAARITNDGAGSTGALPRPLPLPTEDVAPLLSGRWYARFTMAPMIGGESFEVELFPHEAPITVARFVRLARAGYYNGLTFHRVEPGFVIQGGSPQATEFVGDGPFMRDELGLRSHTRGTLGISTRGRDTGDAQLFVNLIDNFRLDHDYTVFGDVTSERGRRVVDNVLEADVIARVEIVRR